VSDSVDVLSWSLLKQDIVVLVGWGKVLSQTRMRVITYKGGSTRIGWFSLLKYASTTKRQKPKFNVYIREGSRHREQRRQTYEIHCGL
jgi:hypothetical protein